MNFLLGITFGLMLLLLTKVIEYILKYSYVIYNFRIKRKCECKDPENFISWTGLVNYTKCGKCGGFMEWQGATEPIQLGIPFWVSWKYKITGKL